MILLPQRYEVITGTLTRHLPSLAHIEMESYTFEPDYVIWDTQLCDYVDLQGNPIHYTSTFTEYMKK